MSRYTCDRTGEVTSACTALWVVGAGYTSTSGYSGHHRPTGQDPGIVPTSSCSSPFPWSGQSRWKLRAVSGRGSGKPVRQSVSARWTDRPRLRRARLPTQRCPRDKPQPPSTPLLGVTPTPTARARSSTAITCHCAQGHPSSRSFEEEVRKEGRAAPTRSSTCPSCRLGQGHKDRGWGSWGHGNQGPASEDGRLVCASTAHGSVSTTRALRTAEL